MNKQEKKKPSQGKRLTIIFGIVGLLLIVCLFTALWHVVRHGDEYRHRALAQATGSSVTILAEPGNITDANGVYLATSKKVFRLILDPAVLDYTEKELKCYGTLDKTVELACKAFSMDPEAMKAAFTADTSRSYVRFESGRVLSEAEVTVYQELVKAFNEEKKAKNAAIDADKNSTEQKITASVAGIWFEEEYRREYPMSSLLSKVVGHTTPDASQGLTGLEYQYDGILRGINGKEYTYVDERGNVTKELTEARDGYTLVTSLDANVAKILKEEIDAYQAGESRGERVNVLVMDPANGEVIAMESDREYDLNDPWNPENLFTEEELAAPAETFLLKEAFQYRPEALGKMSIEEQRVALMQQVQLNYAVSGTFEPGSTAKSLTLATGYETGTLKDNDVFYCDGAIPVANYTIHCHMPTVCGSLHPIEALGRSCNVCLVQIGDQIGKDLFVKYQEIFNLGQKTGIDLPGEANTTNLIYHENNMNAIELATNTFGQGFNVTMLQLAAAYCSLLNGGYYYKPHIVTRIEDSAGNPVEEIEPVLVRRTVSEETSEKIREGLHYVTSKGTASGILNIENYDFGGKTGAAEKLPRGTGKYVVSFIGAAPLANAELLVYVVIDEPNVEDQSSSMPAQELARSIFDRLHPYYGVFPETGEDAYTYDWSSLRSFEGMSDSQQGQEAVEDPYRTIDWLVDEEDTRN